VATITLQNFFQLYDKICGDDRHGDDRRPQILEDLQARDVISIPTTES